MDVAAQKEEEREERIARKERIRKSKEGDDQETNLSVIFSVSLLFLFERIIYHCSIGRLESTRLSWRRC